MADREDVRGVGAGPPACLLVKQGGSAMAEALHRSLRAAGLRVIAVASAYEAVAEAERAGGALRHLVLGVDSFGRDEFRLIPLVRREWPAATIVAYHSPGFEHKGRIAELVGADVVLATSADVLGFLEGLAPSVAPPPRAAARAPRRAAARAAAVEAAPPPAEAAPSPPSADAPAAVCPAAMEVPGRPPTSLSRDIAEALATQKPVAEDAAARAPPRRDVPLTPPPSTLPPSPQAPPPADGFVEDEELTDAQVIGTIELTDEELRLLLGEDEDETPSGGRP